MACVKCKIELPPEELSKKIKCDQCNARLCQACSGLRETEVRVMQLKEKSLKFKCDLCDFNILNSFKQLEQNVIKIIADAQNNFTSLLNSHINEVNEGISQTKSEVIILRESNVELVNLMTNIQKQQIPSSYPLATGSLSSAPEKINKLRTNIPTNRDRIPPNTINPCQDDLSSSHRTPRSSYAETTKKHMQFNKGNNNKTTSILSTEQPIIQSTSQINVNNSQIANNLHNLSDTKRQDLVNDNFRSNSIYTEGEYQVINRRRKKINIGSGDGDEKFHGKAEKNKKIWLFVTRVPDDVEAEDIKNYIKNHTKADNSIEHTHIERDVEVNILKTTNTRPNNRSFMVGVKPEYQDVIYKPSFWPRNIGFERFDFRRGQHFLRNTLQSSDPKRPSTFLDQDM